MWFLLYLHEHRIISGDQFANAVRAQLSRRPMLGQLAMQNRLLSVKQIMQIFAAQVEEPEMQFGELAIDLGLLTRQDVTQLLREQTDSVPPLSDMLVETGVFTRRQMLDELARFRDHQGHLGHKNQPHLPATSLVSS